MLDGKITGIYKKKSKILLHMNNSQLNRRRFIKAAAITTAGLVINPAISKKSLASSGNKSTSNVIEVNHLYTADPRIKFSVIHINHAHIYSMVAAVIRGGGQLVSFYAKEPELAATFSKQFPSVKQVKSEKEILEDTTIQLVLSSGIPDQRAPLGIEVMHHGKDYLVDKPGIITLEQLADVRKVQKETKQIYSIMYSERFENRATVKAGELVKAGAIGKVIQTIGLGPHRMNTATRPDWFFDRKRYGGIITDIGSHQFDQFLFFTGSTSAEILASQTGNVYHPQYNKFEDFGDVMVKGNGGAGYIRVDWFTPNGLKSWGDGRLTILGTDGYIEIRKNVDIANHEGGDHLYIVDQKETRYIDCGKEPLPFGENLVNDIINRTETAMTQNHCFYATELALKAQKIAKQFTLKK
jgi:predicted dehydrogenase